VVSAVYCACTGVVAGRRVDVFDTRVVVGWQLPKGGVRVTCGRCIWQEAATENGSVVDLHAKNDIVAASRLTTPYIFL